MRLVDTKTGEYVDFVDLERTPPYAILSHTWDKDGEQSYQEIVKIQEKYKHHCPPSEEHDPSISHFDDPAAIPAVPTPSEGRTTSSHFPLLMPQGNPRWCSAWKCLELEAPSRPGALSDPDLPNDIQISYTPSIVRPSIWDADSGLSEKVRRACEVARLDGYRYIWIDSCCINKESSSELSEAINSMYNWYRAAQVCYAFLPDVPSDEDVRAERSKFRSSRWFTRGWTLQELIAPLVLVFLSQDWEGLGTKDALADVVYEITSIDPRILTHEREVADESVANRMRWASARKTTRVEDEAYCLLGIFGITMSTLYGEGQYAFRRLQEEILQRIPDQSIFAWGYECPTSLLTLSGIDDRAGLYETSQTLLAPSPRSFALSSGRMVPVFGPSIKPLELCAEEYIRTPYGIRTQLCALPLQALNPGLADSDLGQLWYLVILRSQHAGDPQQLLGRICCFPRRGLADVEFLFLAHLNMRSELYPDGRPISLFSVSLDDLKRVASTQIQLRTVYFPHPERSVAKRQLKGENGPLSLTFPPWARAALLLAGYTVSDVRRPTERSDQTQSPLSLILRHASFNIHIRYRCILIHHPGHGDAVIIGARVWILSPGEEAPETDASMQSLAPHSSATWTDCGRWSMTLPGRSLDLIADSGQRVTLRLGLGLAAPSRYNVRVEVVPTIDGASFRPTGAFRGPPFIPPPVFVPHESFNLVLPGSVRRALEMKGYSARLGRQGSSLGFHSHSLSLTSLSGASDGSGLVVNVKYLHALWYEDSSDASQKLVIVARVTLESSSFDADGSKSFQIVDGPHAEMWAPDLSEWIIEGKHIILTTPTQGLLALRLGLSIAWKDEFHLHADIEPRTLEDYHPGPQSGSLSGYTIYGRHMEFQRVLQLAHQDISLTLPGHFKLALQAQGYRVRLERLDGGGKPGDPVRHLLTLSHIRAGFTITIEYSHHLITRYPEQDDDPPTNLSVFNDTYPFFIADSGNPSRTARAPPKRCDQDLTFRASVWTQSIRDDTRVPARRDPAASTVVWDAKNRMWSHDADVWGRFLRRKDTTLTLPTGYQLVLRLGFYLVWSNEYCLMVEINPRVPLSYPPSRGDDYPPLSDYEFELGEDGMEYIRQALARSTEPGEPTETHDEPLPPGDPYPPISLEGPPVWSREAVAGGEGGDGPDLSGEVDDEEPKTSEDEATATPSQSAE